MPSETICQSPATLAFINITRVVQRKTAYLAFNLDIQREKEGWYESFDSFLIKCLTDKQTVTMSQTVEAATGGVL